MSQKPLTTAELLALAVLRGDSSAINPLLDCLMENRIDTKTGIQLPPITRFQVDKGKLRIIFYVTDPSADINYARVQEVYNNWLNDGRPMVLMGVDRVEFYEIP